MLGNEQREITMAFTEEEWAEIYYAIDSKRSAIANGAYGTDSYARQWEEKLNDIFGRFQAALDDAGVNY